jgi:hypothetical protein
MHSIVITAKSCYLPEHRTVWRRNTMQLYRSPVTRSHSNDRQLAESGLDYPIRTRRRRLTSDLFARGHRAATQLAQSAVGRFFIHNTVIKPLRFTVRHKNRWELAKKIRGEIAAYEWQSFQF